MSPETATDPRIRPAIMPLAEPQATAAKPAAVVERPEAPARVLSGAGGNRVNDYGPGADHPTVAGDFGFADLLDVINPLQHLPVVSSLYRRITGDEIGAPARVMGAALYGGPLGLVVGAASALVAEIAGEDPGEQVLTALIGPPSGGEPPAVALAEERSGGEHHPPVARYSDRQPAFRQAALDAQQHDLPVAPDAPSADQALFAERMMAGLDKYQALAVSRAGPTQPDPAQPGPAQPNPNSLDLSL